LPNGQQVRDITSLSNVNKSSDPGFYTSASNILTPISITGSYFSRQVSRTLESRTFFTDGGKVAPYNARGAALNSTKVGPFKGPGVLSLNNGLRIGGVGLNMLAIFFYC